MATLDGMQRVKTGASFYMSWVMFNWSYMCVTGDLVLFLTKAKDISFQSQSKLLAILPIFNFSCNTWETLLTT